MKCLALLSLLASGTLATSPPAPIATNVHNASVTYSGLYANEVEAFIGIRYGHDTGGSNRFKPPVPYTPTPNSTIDATIPGPACPQRVDHRKPNPFNAYSYVTEISEDCLRLNVWRPNGTTAADKLPVLVYIYGGSFVEGTKDGVLAQPGGMILESIDNGHPIMNVEMNYRLGVFGFAQTDALLQEGSTNAGVRDQRAALEWVHDNIAAFGGDPERITIHGQSSGGLSVGIQIMAYGGTKPAPFQQGICQSQALEPGITGNFTRHAMAHLVEAKTPCTNTSFDSPATVECLRSLSMDELVNAFLKTRQTGVSQNGGDNWLPVVDGDFIPEAPSKLMAEHRFSNIRTVIGWCDNDAVLFTPTNLKTPEQTKNWAREYLPAFSEANIEKLLALYPPSDFHSTHFADGKVKLHSEVYRAGRIYRDFLFTCQPIHYGQVLAAAGNDVYFYDQNQTLWTPDLDKVGLYGEGVVHTSELIYVFGNLSKYDIPGWPYHPGPSDFWLRKHESRSWSSFAALGRPSLEGHETLQGWRMADFDDENYGTYVIGGPYPGNSGSGGNTKAREIMALEKLKERCGFINSPEIIKQTQY